MVTFQVPTHNTVADPLVFKVPECLVLVAGSRRGAVAPQTAGKLVEHLSHAGFGFPVGCAPGVDEGFRLAVSRNEKARETSFIACAFANGVGQSESAGLTAGVVVPDGLSAAAALRRRTLWMVKRCVLLILFPEDPATGRWGKGSRLAFQAALFQLKPVFVVTAKRPSDSPHHRIIADGFYGVMNGYWAVPHPTELGTCDEEW
ncbi:MAG: hypothetical protein V3S41_01355 [Spirochaetia bacterium]